MRFLIRPVVKYGKRPGGCCIACDADFAVAAAVVHLDDGGCEVHNIHCVSMLLASRYVESSVWSGLKSLTGSDKDNDNDAD